MYRYSFIGSSYLSQRLREDHSCLLDVLGVHQTDDDDVKLCNLGNFEATTATGEMCKHSTANDSFFRLLPGVRLGSGQGVGSATVAKT